MTPDRNIFCNTPWYEVHIYWDGSLGICCQEDHKLYRDSEQYNIANMTIQEWFNSEPAKDFRRRISQSSRLSECRRCYVEEDNGGNSRRLKSNQKSVIFTSSAFEESLRQSPGYTKFLHSYKYQGETLSNPIDLHIDLGNFCNLACKMCNARASSTIASQEVRWGIESSRQYLGTDWTKDQQVWNNFKQQLLEIPGLNNIHFMGGETLLTDRFEDLVDTMIAHGRFDLCFSFVTNGTVFKPKLLDKLKKFRRVGIEVSIEAMDEHNAYQRQGTDTKLVLKNIDQYLKRCNGSSITVSLRPAPSIFSIGYYVDLLDYALKKKLIVKSNLVYKPRKMSAEILPSDIKQLYAQRYEKFLEQFNDLTVNYDYNASDPNNYRTVIKQQAIMCLSVLTTPTPSDSDSSLHDLVRHCERWDKIYGYDAVSLYPEWKTILEKYDYDLSS